MATPIFVQMFSFAGRGHGGGWEVCRMMKRLVVSLGVALLLAGCSGGGGTTASPTAAPPAATGTPSDSAGTATPMPDGTATPAAAETPAPSGTPAAE